MMTCEPEVDFAECDLGSRLGKLNTETAYQAKFNAAVQYVDAVGRRPGDWMKRDLLAGASGDDRRLWFFRAVLRNNPGFLVQAYDAPIRREHSNPDLPDEERKSTQMELTTIREARAFDYMSRNYLGQLIPQLEEQPIAFRVAAAASVCPTSLYQTKMLIAHQHGGIRRSQVCRNQWVCPHCYARLAARHLDECPQYFGQANVGFVLLLGRTVPLSCEDANQFHGFRDTHKNALIDIARSAGAEGGIWTQQVCPWLQRDKEFDGKRIYETSTPELELKISVLAVIPKNRPHLRRLQQFDKRVQAEKADFQVAKISTAIDLHAFDAKRSLRAYLVKARDSSQPAIRLENNEYGLFYWPPLSICTTEQWVARFELLHGQPAAVRWGTWHQGSGPQAGFCPESDAPEFFSTHHRADERRAELLARVTPLLAGVRQKCDQMPGRKNLRKLLAGAGVEASERDVRWLISELRKE